MPNFISTNKYLHNSDVITAVHRGEFKSKWLVTCSQNNEFIFKLTGLHGTFDGSDRLYELLDSELVEDIWFHHMRYLTDLPV